MFVELYWLTLSELEPLVLSKSRYRLPRVPVLQHFAVNTELALLLNKPRNWLSAGAKPLSVPRLIFFLLQEITLAKILGSFSNTLIISQPHYWYFWRFGEVHDRSCFRTDLIFDKQPSVDRFLIYLVKTTGRLERDLPHLVRGPRCESSNIFLKIPRHSTSLFFKCAFGVVGCVFYVF